MHGKVGVEENSANGTALPFSTIQQQANFDQSSEEINSNSFIRNLEQDMDNMSKSFNKRYIGPNKEGDQQLNSA